MKFFGANPFRPTVRLKLTMAYGGLFLFAGAILLALNYALVSRSVEPVGAGQSVTFFSREGPGSLGVGPQTQIVVGSAGVPVGGITVPEPTTPDGRKVSDVVKELTTSYRNRTLHELVVKSLQALGVMAVLSIGFGWAIATRALGGLHRMTATARRLSEENLHERIALDGPDDELKELADTFDALLGRLEAAFESQKRFVANASHELRTPLSIIRTEVDVALANPDATPDELRRMGEVVRRATDRSAALIDGLLVLARSDRGPAARESVDLASLAAEALAQSTAEAATAGIQTSGRFDPAPTTGDSALLGRLAGNLIENAIRHNAPGGRLEVVTGPAADADEVRLAVANSVPVIEASEVDALFEPFRRRGADRVAPDLGEVAGPFRGAGLGLSIVRSVAVAHGGRVTARPRPGGGLIVEVFLPTSASASDH
ncbi:MAG TPA: ATP-binding protein [Acidimicrobiia bacterium]|nr:ATP-binding protein [Acidimicrobiia bacterium]